MTRRFTVCTGPDHDHIYRLDVVIHHTQHELARLARRINGPTTPSDVLGCVHPDYGPTKRIGLMRLCTEYLTGEYIIHESVHAAIVLTSKHYGCNPLRLPRDGGQREEDVAFSAQHIASAILSSGEGLGHGGGSVKKKDLLRRIEDLELQVAVLQRERQPVVVDPPRYPYPTLPRPIITWQPPPTTAGGQLTKVTTGRQFTLYNTVTA